MRRFRVELTTRAEKRLADIEKYVAAEASPLIARRFAQSLLERCHSLQHFPMRGTPRDDLRPGLRSVPHRGNAIILYGVTGDTVTIVGIFYAGRDISAALRNGLN